MCRTNFETHLPIVLMAHKLCKDQKLTKAMIARMEMRSIASRSMLLVQVPNRFKPFDHHSGPFIKRADFLRISAVARDKL